MHSHSSPPDPGVLPWPPPHADGESGNPGALQVSPRQVASFDALLHEIHPDAPRVDADRVVELANWLLTQPPEGARTQLERQLDRIADLRAMVADPDWDCDEADCARVRKLVDYLEDGEDLIPDRIPLLGLLDDVLLLELAWPALSGEVDEYRDFCSWRTSEHPSGDGAEQRAAWVRDRMAQLALWQHRLQVHDSHYVEGGHPDRPFRIA